MQELNGLQFRINSKTKRIKVGYFECGNEKILKCGREEEKFPRLENFEPKRDRTIILENRNLRTGVEEMINFVLPTFQEIDSEVNFFKQKKSLTGFLKNHKIAILMNLPPEKQSKETNSTLTDLEITGQSMSILNFTFAKITSADQIKDVKLI